tara:strand:+ start:25 stop:453 length:429 start_codon:yes stop_codon:yes gene_type:complete
MVLHSALGGFCEGNIDWSKVAVLQGWWRVPWSKNNLTFERCPYEADCLGAVRTTDNSNSITNLNINITEGCLPGTSGPLCSICIEGYNRDGGTCNICNDGSVPLRIGIISGVVLILVVILLQCRKRVRKKWQMYRRKFLLVQ